MIVVDTSALVAILRSEPSASQILLKLIAADRAIISTGNVLELQLVLNGREIAGWSEVEDLFQLHNIQIRSFGEAQLRVAREAAARYGKGRHKARLNFGDCFAYALAYDEDAALLCTGADFARTDLHIA